MRLLAPVLLSTLLRSTVSAITFATVGTVDCVPDHRAIMRFGNISAQDGCHKRETDEKGLTLQLEDSNLRDQSNLMVFFKDEECDPAQMLGQTDFGCSNKAGAADWNSFEVWDMCEDNPMCDFGVGPPASEIEALAEVLETDTDTSAEDNTPQGGTSGKIPNPDAQTATATASSAEDDTPQGGTSGKIPNPDAQTATATASSAEDNTPRGGTFGKNPNPDAQTATATASAA